jgi:hypothetical protein
VRKFLFSICLDELSTDVNEKKISSKDQNKKKARPSAKMVHPI